MSMLSMQSVAIHICFFLSIFSSAKFVVGATGVHIVETYSNVGLIRVLYVESNVSCVYLERSNRDFEYW